MNAHGVFSLFDQFLEMTLTVWDNLWSPLWGTISVMGDVSWQSQLQKRNSLIKKRNYSEMAIFQKYSPNT